MSATIGLMQASDSWDISFHLPTLALLDREFHLRTIVELGTRGGISTTALIEAARVIGGSVLSVDLAPCLEARQRIEKTGLANHWTFIQSPDMILGDDEIPPAIDLLFIDTSHQYTHTRQELENFGRRVRSRGWIALHDYTSYEGVPWAVHDLVASLETAPALYPFLHQNGLGLLRMA